MTATLPGYAVATAPTLPTAPPAPPAPRDFLVTPTDVYAALDAEYGPFFLDAAATAATAKVPAFFGPGSPYAEDCLTVPWSAFWIADAIRVEPITVFCKSPYSGPYPFVAKAHAEAVAGRATTTLLLPATTEVRWWKEFVWDRLARRPRPGVAVDFWPWRIRYLRADGTPDGTPKVGSVVVTFRAGLGANDAAAALTDRQRTALRLIYEGRSDMEIADALCAGRATTKHLITSAYAAIGVDTARNQRVQAALWWERHEARR